MGLMQGSERRQAIERRQEIGRHEFGPIMIRTAMNHAMAHGGELIVPKMSLRPGYYSLQQGLKWLVPIRPAPFPLKSIPMDPAR